MTRKICFRRHLIGYNGLGVGGAAFILSTGYGRPLSLLSGSQRGGRPGALENKILAGLRLEFTNFLLFFR